MPKNIEDGQNFTWTLDISDTECDSLTVRPLQRNVGQEQAVVPQAGSRTQKFRPIPYPGGGGGEKAHPRKMQSRRGKPRGGKAQRLVPLAGRR